ncbi:MAG TPA: hypothetical protein VFN56_01880 [Candidatus Saccharimonadales bacterium]|nr:hypothetical protein [Candidatus Saccharimonadales bacterium]
MEQVIQRLTPPRQFVQRAFNNRLIRPWIVVLMACVALILFNLYIAQHFIAYTSDDVSWQTILLTWSPFNGHKLYLGGSDNYIIRAPLLALLVHILGPTRRALFIESYILELGNFVLFFTAVMYFLRKVRAKLTYSNMLPLIWLASFGLTFATLFLNSNLRSFEIGMSFLFFALVNELLTRTARLKFKQWVLLVVSSLSAGVLIFNDPYFLYFTVIPIGLLFLFLALYKRIPIQKLLVIVMWCILALLFAITISKLVSLMGIVIPYADPLEFVAYSGLFSNITLALHGLLLIFSADFFGQKVFGISAVSAIINLLIVGFSLWLLRMSSKARRDNDEPTTLWILYFGFIAALVITVYVVSTLAIDITSYRYFVMLVFAFVALLVLAGSKLVHRQRLVLNGLLILAILGNVCASIAEAHRLQHTPMDSRANSVNYSLISSIQEMGLTKGYGSYWNGDINTYLSGGKTNFLPVVCQQGKTVPYFWLVDGDNFKRSVSSSFYVIDPAFPSPPVCTKQQLLSQFGTPSKDVFVAGKEVLVYSYDIQHRM